MSDIFETVLCRESQINELSDLLAKDEPLPHSIIISGNRATGKTLCVEKLLKHLDYKHVFVNCIECYTPKIMYNLILDGLWTEDVKPRCDSLKDLLEILNSIADQLDYDAVVIVLDKAERLMSMDHTVMFALARLKEYCDLNVCTILMTNVNHERFFLKNGLREPIKIYFPNYTKEELYQIICSCHKSFVDYVLKCHKVTDNQDVRQSELFNNFLNAFLSVFYRPCRDLIELMNMARVNFLKYCEPIVNGDIKSHDQAKLWRHISPILKNNLELLYLHTHSNVKPNENDTEATQNKLKQQLTSTLSFAQSFELPHYAKYLLISAYLASYNPPKEDKRLFMKNHGKKRKTMHQVKSKAKISEKLNTQIGPKYFTLDRLLAIFYAIVEERASLTSNILSQIASLERLKLIISNHDTIDLDNGKYKCVAGYDFVTGIAQSVDFKLRKYLYDFI